MTMKGWVLGRMNRMSRRDDPRIRDSHDDAREPTVSALAPTRDGLVRAAEHLGPYAPLIAAIREELEQFAATQLRLHLAIAERDRYLLTSIDVECDESGEHRDLLRRFGREFRPEQIKRYLAKEIIAGLRNASAIDLTQFAGLNADDDGREEAEDAYGALLDELASGAPAPARPYKVTLVGRWSENDARTSPSRSPTIDSPQTPLAGRTLDVDVEDADGVRRISLSAVMPGRRYVVGKDEACDIVVNGVFVSRRHCEIWLDRGAWWILDCGSTNGLRVESPSGVVGCCDPAAPGRAPIEVAVGASIVLSAHARGDAKHYPRLVLRGAEASTTDASVAEVNTPVTPIAPPRRRDGTLTISTQTASGVRSVDVGPDALPFGVGRSRNQAFVIDWSHEDVSGHHLDIVAIDAGGASVVVHGDNGVSAAGEVHGPGARFQWKPGETVVLGRSGSAASCTLTLSRAP